MGETQQTEGQLVVKCECGFEARGTAAEIVPAMQRHGSEAHNMDAKPEEVLARAQPA